MMCLVQERERERERERGDLRCEQTWVIQHYVGDRSGSVQQCSSDWLGKQSNCSINASTGAVCTHSNGLLWARLMNALKTNGWCNRI